MARRTDTNYAIGDLNPVLSSSNQATIDKSEGFFSILKRTAELVHTPNATKGVTQLLGVVLRRERDIEWTDQIPANSWLSQQITASRNKLGEYDPSRPVDSLEEPLQAYKIYIPELHSQLTRPTACVSRKVMSPQHRLIDQFPTFVASSSRAINATEGQIVRVSFVNMDTRTGPIYLGPVYNKPVGPVGEDESSSASQNFKKDNGPAPQPPPADSGGGEGIE